MSSKKINLSPNNYTSTQLDTLFRAYDIYDINFQNVYDRINADVYVAEFELNFGNYSFEIQLQRNDVRNRDYVFLENGQKVFQRDISDTTEVLQTFKGFANGDVQNIVRLNISEDNFWGYIHDNLTGEWIFIEGLNSITRRTDLNNAVIIYHLEDVIDKNECQLVILNEQTKPEPQMKGSNLLCQPRYLEIATEADYEYYQSYGNQSNQRILNTLNLAEGVYSFYFNIMFSVTNQNTWTISADPYNSLAAFDRILELRTYWNSNFSSINRDLVIYYTGVPILQNGSGNNIVTGTSLTYDPLNPGTVCRYPQIAYCLITDGTTPSSTTAHEIGHALNMPHPFDVSGNSDCSNDPGLMCYGDIGFFFNNSSIQKTLDFISEWGGCMDNYDAGNINSQWVQGWSNRRNPRWIGTWNMSSNDRLLIADYDGDGDDELFFIGQENWATLLDYSCVVGSDWFHLWSNMGNNTIYTWYMHPGDKYFAGDFDGDGISELLSISGTNDWATLQGFDPTTNNWYYKWSNYGNSLIGGWFVNSSDKFVIGDFDSDGADEILCFSSAGWSKLINFTNGAFVDRWSNGGNGLIGAVAANPSNLYMPGDFSNGNGHDEILTWVQNWVTLLRWDDTSSSWLWIWSQYGANNFANMYLFHSHKISAFLQAISI